MHFKKKYSNSNVTFVNYFKSFSTIRWIFFSALFFFLTSFGLLINQIVDKLLQNQFLNTPWTTIDKFTWQSNMLLLIFSIFFVFFPKHQFLKTDSFLISSLSYIFFTFFGYNFILTILEGGYPKDPFDCFVSVWAHLVCPVVFMVSGILRFFLEPQTIKLRKFSRTLILGMIYPTIYVIYLSTIPFVFNTNDGEVYTVYNIATDTKNHPQIAWPAIASIYLIFFPLTFAGFYFSAKKIKIKKSK
ncbi:DUF1600 domain-containing protein [Mycoplasmoides alvi]|uniref:DUF1600 domain-containing protein n=1 Tax=Mycoplasmoides alvi TaxID=78580 RepID=UPI000695E20C|nr:DUF1600 domain-containing protein [Mycoplasmoides alvi]